MHRLALGVALVVSACTGTDPGDDASTDSPVEDDSDTEVRDTDSDRPDSDPPSDDETDTDTDDVEPDTDDSDSDQTVAPPPWHGSFVVLTSAVEADYPAVTAGDPANSVSPQQTTLLVGDLDEDGVLEALSTTIELEGQVSPVATVWRLGGAGPTADGTFAAQVLPGDMAVGVTGLLDLDGDGHLDLVTGSTTDLVAWGDGTGAFGFGSGGPTTTFPGGQTCRSTTALTPWDLDSDGWLDLIVAPTVCEGPVRVLRRTGPRSYDAGDGLEAEDGGHAKLHTILSHRVGTEQRHLLVGSTSSNPMHPGWLVGPPLTTRVLVASRTPDPVYWLANPATADATALGVRATAALATDLDQDGHLDVLLAASTTPVVLFRGTAAGVEDLTLPTDIQFHSVTSTPQHPWGLGAADLDQDGQLDLVGTFGAPEGGSATPVGGVYESRAWRQRGPWQFDEVGDALGLRQAGSWHGLVLFDLDDDGDADVAMGGSGTPPRLLRNEVLGGTDPTAPHHGLSLQLIGTSSNHLALGAEVEVDVPGLAMQRRSVFTAASPGALQAPTLFVGMGGATHTDEVRVRWPSGWTQVFPTLAADTAHTLVEPPLFTLPDPDRHVPADAFSTAWLEVRPRHADGTVNTSATVSLRLDGPGTIATTGRWRGDAWTVEVRAPATPGETRLVLTVDGVEVPVQPVLWWD